MFVNRDAAAIVADGQAVAGVEENLDPVGVACHRFVHRIVENFGGKVVQRAFVRAADVHAGTAADRLKPLQHFDRGTVIGFAGACRQLVEQVIGHGERL